MSNARKQLEHDHFDAAVYCGMSRVALSDALDAIEAQTVTAATADLNASEAMWHRRATLAEAALDALAKEVVEMVGWHGDRLGFDSDGVRWIAEEDVLAAIKNAKAYREDTE